MLWDIFCKGKFLWGIIRLIDHGLIRNLHHAFKDPFLWLTVRLTDKLVDWLIALCKLIGSCFEPCHKFSVSYQGTKYLNSIGRILKIAFFFACKKMILKCSFIGSMKKIAPLLSYVQELLLQLNLKEKLVLLTAACRWG